MMFGFEIDEVPRTLDGWQGLVHPEDAAIARRALHAHLADADVPYRTEFRMRTKHGDWTWVLAAGAVIERGPDGRGRRMVGVNVDINDRKRLEQALSDAALTDSLTQLPNRAGIQQALARCVAVCTAIPAKPSPCCSWISTASRWSTTAWATRPATSCCARSRSA
jgi:PAS domain S-box-containing protein